MISWLQTNFQKHFRFMFIVLLVVIVIAFVFTIGNQGSFGGAEHERSANLRFFDVALDTKAKQERFLQRDPQLAAMLSGSRQPASAFFRAAALHVANLHAIPEPNEAELTRFIKSRPIFQDRTGAFSPQTYSMMVDNMKMGGFSTEADMIRVLRDEYRIDKVRSVLAGPGYTDKEEILDSIRDSSTKWTALVATYDLNQYNPEIEASVEELKKYFEEHKLEYMTPARRTVNYVEFDAADFVDEVALTDEELVSYFENNYSRYQPKPEAPAEGEEAKPVEPVTFEQVRSQVREDYRQDKARDLAHERAYDLVMELVNTEADNQSDAFKSVLSSFGVESKSAPAFAASERPIGTVWSQEQVRQAFLLSPEKYYSDPFLVNDKAVVMFYDSVIDSVLPEFETLVNTINRDYREQELAKLRQAYGEELRAKLAEASESEEAFGAAAEIAGLTTARYESFSAREPAAGMDPSLLGALRDLELSEVSDPVKLREPNKIAFVYPLSKEAPEISEDSPEYRETAGYLAEYFGNATANTYLNKLVVAEQERTQISQQ